MYKIIYTIINSSYCDPRNVFLSVFFVPKVECVVRADFPDVDQ